MAFKAVRASHVEREKEESSAGGVKIERGREISLFLLTGKIFEENSVTNERKCTKSIRFNT